MGYRPHMIDVNSFTPHPDKIFVRDMESGVQKSQGGIILGDDNMSERGIRPRWAEVAYVGENRDEVKVGEFVLLEHGRWSYALEIRHPDGREEKLWYIDENGIMGAGPQKYANEVITL